MIYRIKKIKKKRNMKKLFKNYKIRLNYLEVKVEIKQNNQRSKSKKWLKDMKKKKKK